MANAPDRPAGPVSPGLVDATLRPLLGAQLRRLRRRYAWFGAGVTLAAATLAVLLFFGLDHWLRLPLPIRLLHSTAVVALVVAGGVRFLRYPLTRRFADVDLAAWIEGTFPELHQSLVSALQLHGSGEQRNQSAAMIDRLVAETAAMASTLPFDRLFDDRRLRRVVGVAALAVGALLVGTASHPAIARAFVLRHLGLAVDYPRETDLVVELPPASQDLQRVDRAGITELILPAGADLHVSVLAQGVVPKDVVLDVTPRRDEGDASPAARSITMTPRPGGRFRYVFRRLSGTFEFHARGGDDEHGDRVVVVRTVHPPQVASLTASVTPPAYTGTGTIEQPGGAIEALIGSSVSLSLTTTAAVQRATMVFLETGRRLEMQPTALQDDSGAGTVYRCGFPIEGSDRYQIELLAASGLRNPNPGTYPIAALQDYAPVGRWLLPDDEAQLLLPTAILCVRLDVHDDFGLRSVQLGIDRAGAPALQKALLAPPSAAAAPPTKAAIVTELLEVKDLLGAAGAATAAAAGNDGLLLRATLDDNRAPQANATELPRRIVQIVDGPQLASAIAKAFRSLREEVGQALEIQADRRARLQDVIARTDMPALDLAQALTGIEVGQTRVNSACERAHRALMRSFDVHLWNRLETSQNAAAVVELYRQRSAGLTEALAVDPEFYRDLLKRRQAGTLGAMETTLDPILAMVGIADVLTATAGPETSRLLAEAQVARGAADRTPLLQHAATVQETIERSLQQLLSRLEEWNDYQDLIQETRALRDRQRDLQNRTDEVRGKK